MGSDPQNRSLSRAGPGFSRAYLKKSTNFGGRGCRTRGRVVRARAKPQKSHFLGNAEYARYFGHVHRYFLTSM